MSRERPITAGRARPGNIVVDLREAFLVLNGIVVARLASRGHGKIRAAHGAVFQYIDDAGTTVSTLAERAQMTKQAMAELVQYLELHEYVTRIPDPQDRRAKLVRPTVKGLEVIAIAQGVVPEAENHVADTVGRDRLEELRNDLHAIYAATVEKYAGEETRDRR